MDQEVKPKILRRKELIKYLADNSSYHKYEIADMYDAFTNAIIENILEGNDIYLDNLFQIKSYIVPEKTLRHPITGISTTFPPSLKIKAVVSKALKDKVKERQKLKEQNAK